MQLRLFYTILLITFFAQANAQKATYILGKSISELSKLENIPQLKILRKQINESTNNKSLSLTPLPQYYCYNNLAFFCKIEVKMEQNFKYPFKFRLGSVDHVDYLEGKGLEKIRE
jgi:hypothetical protein